MKYIKTCTLLCAMTIILLVSQTSFSQMRLPSTYIGQRSVQIDGQIVEWVNLFRAERGIQFSTMGQQTILQGKNGWQDDSDLKAEFTCIHNNEALYVAIRINDKDLIRTESYYTTEDHVEIWLAMTDDDRERRSIGLGIFSKPETSKVSVRMLDADSKQATAKIEAVDAAVTGMNSFYTLEIRIPFDILAGDDYLELSEIGAAIYLVDNDSDGESEPDTIIGTAPVDARTIPTKIPSFKRTRAR